jgi:hypothetical protein
VPEVRGQRVPHRLRREALGGYHDDFSGLPFAFDADDFTDDGVDRGQIARHEILHSISPF